MDTNHIKKKNRNIFILFTIVFTICSFALLILDNVFKPLNYFLIFGALLLFISQDLLTVIITKKITKEKLGLAKCVNIFDLLCIIILGIIILFNNRSTLIISTSVIMIIKIIIWLINIKLLLKDNIKNKIIIIIGIILFFIIVLLKNLFLMPSEFNKNIFIKYGKTDFSSKILYTELIDEYNSNNKYKKVNYFYKLSDEDLTQITNLSYSETNSPLTNKDLAKLINLENLTISGLAEENLDLTNNKKIKIFELLSDQKINNILFNENVEHILIKQEFDTLDISNLLNLKSLNAKVNKLKIYNLNQIINSNIKIEVKKIIVESEKEISISNNFFKIDVCPRINKDIIVPNNTIVENIMSNEYELEVYNTESFVKRKVSEKIENGDSLKINSQGNTLATFKIRTY